MILEKVGVVLSDVFCQPTSKIHFDSLHRGTYFQTESIPKSTFTRKLECHCELRTNPMNPILQIQLDLLHHTTFGFL